MIFIVFEDNGNRNSLKMVDINGALQIYKIFLIARQLFVQEVSSNFMWKKYNFQISLLRFSQCFHRIKVIYCFYIGALFLLGKFFSML